MKWIKPYERKPEGKVFWGLTMGRDEQGHRDWEIRKFWNDEMGDYRTLDSAGAFRLPGQSDWADWQSTIYAWFPLEEIPINDKDYE